MESVEHHKKSILIDLDDSTRDRLIEAIRDKLPSDWRQLDIWVVNPQYPPWGMEDHIVVKFRK